MKDLLKEAIADAKAVKETALANAKIALEEAFTPRLQSMLSAKLAEEMDDETEETSDSDEPEMTDDYSSEESEETPEMTEEEYDSEESAEHTEEEMSEGSEDDDLDLDEIIRELEDSEDDLFAEAETSDDDDYAEIEVEEGEETSEDDDIDINEIIRSLREEESEEEEKEEVPHEELEEAYNVIRFLKGKINEVNLLNAKLLYSNKLFRNFSLNEGQKMKVIENFDRAHNLREVKLVYSTLAEGFKMPSTKKVVKESFASKPIASTKPAGRVISEGADLAARFQKLAGLKK